MKILEADNLCKNYGKGSTLVKAIDNVSFTVDEGDFVAIVGSSGSGKSTLLHILGAVDKPTSGKVIVGGTDVFKQKDDALAVFRRRKVGLIYQFYNLIPILNVEENMTLPILLDGKKVDKKYLKELIDILGLERRVNLLPNELYRIYYLLMSLREIWILRLVERLWIYLDFLMKNIIKLLL